MASPFKDNEEEDNGSVDLTKKYPDAKEVANFHRHSDRDKSRHSIHHSLGSARYQASPGDHTHTGQNSALLFDAVFDQDLGTSLGIRNTVKAIITEMAKAGAEDATTG